VRLNAKRRQALEGKRGSALTLAAISLVVLLAMAGLAVDLAMLYVARSEAQRAADAAAMTGAQGIGQADYPSVSQAIAEAFAANQAATVGNQNLVVGLAPGLDPSKYSACAGDAVPAGEDICFNFSNPSDPRVSVVVQRTAARGTGIPLFFMRIFGIDTADVSATATAEYFTASNRQCLKPWLLANCDPYHTLTGVGGKPPNDPRVNPNCPAQGNQYLEFFIYPLTPPYNCDPAKDADGCLVNPGAADAKSVAACGVVNVSPNTGGVVGECLTIKPGNPAGAGAPSQYYPVQIPTNGVTPSCPSCNTSGTQGGAAAYQQNIACCNLSSTALSCGTGQQLTMKTGNMVGPTSQGVDCLIHEFGGSGQDVISFANGAAPDCTAPTGGALFNICGGESNPYGQKGQSISSSDSLVTVPVYDGGTLCPGIGGGGGGGASGSCVTSDINIDGYLTIFIKTETNPQGTVYAQVIGGGGCGAVPTTTQVPVRLIHN
jgi:Flp pilus assembly protein TadG